MRTATRMERIAHCLFLSALAAQHLAGRWEWTATSIHTYFVAPEMTVLDLFPYVRAWVITVVLTAALVLQYGTASAPERRSRAARWCWLLLALCLPGWICGWVPRGAMAWAFGAWLVRRIAFFRSKESVR